MFSGFSHSVRGASHEKTGLVCQDSSAYKLGERYAVVVVADGHGSKKHFRSHLGSQFAVESAIEAIDRFYENSEAFESNLPENHARIIRNIEKQIIFNWNRRIEAHLSECPVTEEEKSKFSAEDFEAIPPESYYGSTLVVAVAGTDYTFGLQIGDGSLVAVMDDGAAVMPMAYNESAPANLTASMCNSNAARLFNSFYLPNRRLIALFSSTDGLYTSFGSEYDFLDYHTILTSRLGKAEEFEQVMVNNLKKRTHYGTEDDISLACVFHTGLVGEKSTMLQEKVAENKERSAKRKAEQLAKRAVR